MTLPSDTDLPPALNPERRWARNFIDQDNYFSLMKRPETSWNSYTRERTLFSLRKYHNLWVMKSIEPRREEIALESADPPFQLAEALYDAAK
jgi:hypothetical protein